MTQDLPQHARERIAEMRERKLFTSDLSVSEFLLVKEAGFDPLGLVMGSSIYQIAPTLPESPGPNGCEITDMTRALYHARELAMTRMEEEADELGADGIVGLRLTLRLGMNQVKQQWELYREWQDWAVAAGFPRSSTRLGGGWERWQRTAAQMWSHYCQRLGWTPEPQAPWARPRAQTTYAFGQNAAEFLAIGCAVRHRGGESYKNVHGKPFQSDLSGQDFWTLIRSGYRPVGFVMGNCVYYVPPRLLKSVNAGASGELGAYTHALYDARELATERLQDEAEALNATGIVGVTFAEREHSGRFAPWNAGNGALKSGEVIELFVVGTAVVPSGTDAELPQPTLILPANDPPTEGPEGQKGE
ncbi:MAG: heavy metal-binding domain-containing protein [Polyangiaceae bacterium]